MQFVTDVGRYFGEHCTAKLTAQYTPGQNKLMSLVQYQFEDGVAILRIDDGKRNALAPEVLDEIYAAFDRAEADRAIVIVTGREDVFSAGFDLKVMQRGGTRAIGMLHRGYGLPARVLNYPYPVIVACNGHSLAMGVFLMLAADHAIGIHGDFVVGMNESAIGMVLPLYATTLGMARLAPAGRKAIATGELFSPQRGLEVGYFDRVVEAGELDATVEAVIAHMKSLNAGAFDGNKKIINAQLIADVEAAPLPDFG